MFNELGHRSSASNDQRPRTGVAFVAPNPVQGPVHSSLLLSTVIPVHISFQSTLQFSPVHFSQAWSTSVPSKFYSSAQSLPVHGPLFTVHCSPWFTSVYGLLQSTIHFCSWSNSVHSPLHSLVHTSPLVYFVFSNVVFVFSQIDSLDIATVIYEGDMEG